MKQLAMLLLFAGLLYAQATPTLTAVVTQFHPIQKGVPPPTPTNNEPDAVISWNAVPTGGYTVNVLRSNLPGQEQAYTSITYPVGAITTCWPDGPLPRSTDYYYKITICDSTGKCTNESNEVYVRTPDDDGVVRIPAKK
jgi:hypothetical protein